MTLNPKTDRRIAKIIKNLAVNALLLALPLTAFAKDEFTAMEQQKINIETPGLFSHSNIFNVDFAALRPADYSFPLPVGRAVRGKDYAWEIETTKGDAVKAMFEGTVRMSRNHSVFGNVIVLRHDNGLETMYARNAQNLVKVGDRVKAGQTIAIVGGEGVRTYCEFAVMVNGSRINPEIILGIKSQRLHRKTIQCKNNGGGRVEVSMLDAPEQKEDKEVVECCYPLPGAKVISPYGRRGGRGHTGVDLKTKAGDNILAAFAGEVIFSAKYAGYGNFIRIRHANGLETCYSHNSKNLVKLGDKVKAGQVIALTGRTGRATTDHLHFEVRINGAPVNPGKYFDHTSHTVKPEAKKYLKK